jgi:hypothetical protein
LFGLTCQPGSALSVALRLPGSFDLRQTPGFGHSRDLAVCHARPRVQHHSGVGRTRRRRQLHDVLGHPVGDIVGLRDESCNLRSVGERAVRIELALDLNASCSKAVN